MKLSAHDRVNVQCNIVASKEDEEERDDGCARSSMTSLSEGAGETSDNNVANQHDRGRCEKQRLAPKTIDTHGSCNGPDQIPHLKTTTYSQLVSDTCDANRVQYEGQVVRYNSISGPLSEDAERYGDEESLAITRCPGHVHVARRALCLFLSFDSTAYLNHLIVDQSGVKISTGMPIDQDVPSFFDSAFGNEPSRALRYH